MQSRARGSSSDMKDGDVYDVVVDKTVAAEPILLQKDEIETLTAAARKVVEAQTLKKHSGLSFLGLGLSDFIYRAKQEKIEVIDYKIEVIDYKKKLFENGVSFEEWSPYVATEPKPFIITPKNDKLEIIVNGDISAVVQYFQFSYGDMSDSLLSTEQHESLHHIITLMTTKLGFLPEDNVEVRSLEIRRMRQYTLNEKGFETEILTFVPESGNSPDTSYIMQRKESRSEPLSLDGKPHVDGQGVPGTGHSKGNSSVNFVVTLGHSGTQVYPLQRLQWSSEKQGLVVDPSELRQDKARATLNAIINTNAIPHCAPGDYTQSDADMPPDRFMIRLSCRRRNLLTLQGQETSDMVSNVRWPLRF